MAAKDNVFFAVEAPGFSPAKQAAAAVGFSHGTVSAARAKAQFLNLTLWRG